MYMLRSALQQMQIRARLVRLSERAFVPRLVPFLIVRITCMCVYIFSKGEIFP